MTTRRALGLGLGVVGLLASAQAHAGSYLDRASLLVAQAFRANAFLRKHLSDRELARLVRRASEGRLQGAKTTLVPEEVAMAHPHLLLMLEHYERAAAAAESGDVRAYHRLQHQALEEEQIFRGVLAQLGWRIDESGR